MSAGGAQAGNPQSVQFDCIVPEGEEVNSAAAQEFVVPAGVTSVQVQATGAGGGGFEEIDPGDVVSIGGARLRDRPVPGAADDHDHHDHYYDDHARQHGGGATASDVVLTRPT